METDLPKVIKEDEFTRVEYFESTGIVKKTTQYPHEDNNRHHLEREARNLERANKQQLPVVNLHTFGYDERTKIGVIETDYYSSVTLKEWLNDNSLTWSQRVKHIKIALQVLEAIHRSGILLFDPNLGNFLINKSNKIIACDFGLASSKEYPHLVHPPTTENSNYYSKHQNEALEKSEKKGTYKLLNELTAKDDLFVFAKDIRRHVVDEMLSYEAWSVVDNMIEGRYQTAEEAAKALPDGTPIPQGLKSGETLGTPKPGGVQPDGNNADTASNRPKLSQILITLALGGGILVGGIAINNHNLQTRTSNELRQQAISSSINITHPAPQKAMSTSRAVPVEPTQAQSGNHQAVKEEYRKESKPDGSVLLTNIPRKAENGVTEKEQPTSNEKRSATKTAATTQRTETNLKGFADRKTTREQSKKAEDTKREATEDLKLKVKKAIIEKKLRKASELEKTGDFSGAYRAYQKLKILGAKDSEKAISILEEKVQELIDTKSTRKAGYKLLKSIADQQGNPKAKLYYGLALLNGAIDGISEKNNKSGIQYVKQAIALDVDPNRVKDLAAKIENKKIADRLLSMLARK